MIDQLKSMAIFASVVDEASFRGAAKKLNLSPAIVSIHVKKLEEKIGAPLLYRSTRCVTLTQDGKVFYQSAKSMLNAARDGLDKFAQGASTQLTELRVAIPDTLSTNPIIEKITAFTKNHTGIRLNLISTDQQQNLIGEGHDVAIRMGHFKNSEMKSKRIGEDRRVLVASPSFVNSQPRAKHPEDLKSWDFVSFSLVPDYIDLKKANKTSGNIWGNVIAKASSTHSVKALCIAGLGVAALPFHQVERDLKAGRLIQILPDWQDCKTLPIYLVWVPNADLSIATREFINFMSKK